MRGRSINPAADKQQRAQAIQARTAMKMVHFPAFTRWWPDAQDQILKFPHGAKDDFVDAHVSDRARAGQDARSYPESTTGA